MSSIFSTSYVNLCTLLNIFYPYHVTFKEYACYIHYSDRQLHDCAHLTFSKDYCGYIQTKFIKLKWYFGWSRLQRNITCGMCSCILWPEPMTVVLQTFIVTCSLQLHTTWACTIEGMFVDNSCDLQLSAAHIVNQMCIFR